jgi:hypothetical protein
MSRKRYGTDKGCTHLFLVLARPYKWTETLWKNMESNSHSSLYVIVMIWEWILTEKNIWGNSYASGKHCSVVVSLPSCAGSLWFEYLVTTSPSVLSKSSAVSGLIYLAIYVLFTNVVSHSGSITLNCKITSSYWILKDVEGREYFKI